MKRNSPFLVLALVICSLLAAGLACSGSNSSTPTNTAVSTSNGSSQTSAVPSSTSPKNIAGTYDASGTNPDGGGSYKANLVVTPRDEVYQFSWTSGTNTYDGVGVMTDNAVAVSYTDGPDGKGCGVVLYKINSDGSLDGKSGYWGVNQSEEEHAVRTSGSDLEGTYDVSGTNPKGERYNGTLTVANDGSGYSFAWNTGTPLKGFGIRAGDLVAVGFGGPKCAFVGYDVKPDGTLDGKWGSQTTNKFGTEVAKKK